MIMGFHKAHRGFRIYILLPVGTVIPAINSFKFFWDRLREASGRDERKVAQVKQLFDAVEPQGTTVEFTSQMVVLRFTRPETRDAWHNAKLGYGRSTVTLKATDRLTSEDPMRSFDSAAVELLYHVLLVGKAELMPAEVHAILHHASGQVPGKVEEVQTPLGPHLWKVSFMQTSCPKALLHVRRLEVSMGERTCIIPVHHPRSSFSYPCESCLSTRHSKKDCKNAHKDESLLRHTLTVSVAEDAPNPKLLKYKSKFAFDKKLTKVRAEFYPELHTKTQAKLAKRTRDAEAAEKRAAEANAAAEAKLRAQAEAALATEVKEKAKAERQAFMQDAARQVDAWSREKVLELATAKPVTTRRGRRNSISNVKDAAQLVKENGADVTVPLPAGESGDVQRSSLPSPPTPAPAGEASEGVELKDKSLETTASAATKVDCHATPTTPPPGVPEPTPPAMPAVKKAEVVDLTIDTAFRANASTPQVACPPRTEPNVAAFQVQGPLTFSMGQAVASPKPSEEKNHTPGRRESVRSPRKSALVTGGTPKSPRRHGSKASGAGKQQPDGTKEERSAVEAAPAPPGPPAKPKRPFIPIDQHFAPVDAREIEWRGKQEEDRATPTNDGPAASCQDDVAMPYGPGDSSPKKRTRQPKSKPTNDADGDVVMVKSAVGRPSKRERGLPQAAPAPPDPRVEDDDGSDDFLPDEEQPGRKIWAQRLARVTSPGAGPQHPTLVQASVTEFFGKADVLGSDGPETAAIITSEETPRQILA